MSSFICDKCGAQIIDSPGGYITGCEHWPLEGNAMYRMGREARAQGYGRDACNIPRTRAVNRGWWLAGYHDKDMEMDARNFTGAD